MATEYKILGQSAPAGTGDVDLYTVPAATQTVVSTIAVTNDTATAATFRIYLRKAGAAAGALNALYFDAPLAGNSTLLATGADGHEGENWGLKYTFDGYAYASKVIAELANKYADGRVLIGGAGGYQPYTHTPRIWANVVRDIYTQTNEGETNAN